MLLLSVLLSGCFETDPVAVVPSEVLTQGWSEKGRDSGSKWYGLAASWTVIEYRVTPERKTIDSGPYPASLTLMTIDTTSRLEPSEVRDKLERQIRDNAASQDLMLKDGSRAEGTRTLASGVKTTWFHYDAVIGEDSRLFSPGHEARVIGEVGFDERSKITFVAVGLAQVQGSGPTGQYFRDTTHWEKIVQDPDGTIDGHTGNDGLVWNIRSH